MTRASGEFAVAHGALFPAQGLPGDPHPERLKQPLRHIDKTPSYDAMDGGHGSALDHRRQRRPVLGIQSRRPAGGLAVDQAFRTTAVELHNPVADNLHSDTADPCGLAPRRTLVNRRKRQKPTRLRSILRALRRQAARNRIKIRPSATGMTNIPPFATLNQTYVALGTPNESDFQGSGIIQRVAEVPFTYSRIAHVDAIFRPG